MQILQIANGYLGSRLYGDLFAALEELGIEDAVYVPLNRKTAPPPLNSKNTVFSPCFSNLDRVLFFPKQRRILQDIENRSLHQGPSMVHAHTLFSGGYAASQLRRRYGLPYIVTVRNTDVNVFFKQTPYLRKTGLHIMETAERIVFLSPAYLDQVFSRYIPTARQETLRSKCLVIPNGIAPLFYETPPMPRAVPGTPLRLIYAGEISSNKNLETTVRATELLRREGMDVHILVVGNIREETYHPLLEGIAFLEYHPLCPQPELIRYLRSADIFVMPSHTETFGLVYAEAMSHPLHAGPRL